jgi:aryl-alcohol dehydrogenase-like predicted oxidoreductase
MKALAQVALRFLLQQPGVSIALCGAVSLAELRENLGAGSAPPLDVADLRQIAEIHGEA